MQTGPGRGRAECVLGRGCDSMCKGPVAGKERGAPRRWGGGGHGGGDAGQAGRGAPAALTRCGHPGAESPSCCHELQIGDPPHRKVPGDSRVDEMADEV